MRNNKSDKKCPNCGKQSQTSTAPFCSVRCRDVDLANWFNGNYTTPILEEDNMDDDYSTE
ncbi:MAG: DNA gyrase inhibitor YacG [Rickettsiales bacterium]